MEAVIASLEADWGTGLALDYFCPSVAGDSELRANFGQYQRRSASPSASTEYMRTVVYCDVRTRSPS